MGELHVAVKADDYDLVGDLLSDGEDPNEEDEDGNTPLDLAENPDIEELLFMYGAYRDLDYYDDMRYCANYENIFHFDEAFKDEIIIKLTNMNNANIEDIDEQTINEATDTDSLFYDLKVMGVKAIRNGIPKHTSTYVSTYDLNDLLERCGYKVNYEGPNNPIEGQTGIYFIE